jgi:ligand-binding sensor domain-containing protein
MALGLFVITTAASAQAEDKAGKDGEGPSSSFLTLGVANGLPAGGAWSVAPAKDGGVWVGTDAGLLRYRGEGASGRFENVSARIGLGKVAVRTVLEDSKGAVWIGTTTKGLFRWRNGTLTKFDRARGMSGDSILALMEDPTGRLWIGTDAGLNAIFKGELYMLPKGVVNLGPVTMSSLLLDRDGRLWIATHNRGVLVLDGNRVHRYGLGSETRVTTLFEDRDGTLWLGTTTGLARLRGGEFTALRSDRSPIHDAVQQLLEDPDGRLWVTTRRGLFAVDRWQLQTFLDSDQSGELPEFRSYGGAGNLRAVEFNGGYGAAAALTADGKLWLPTSQGLVVHDPVVEEAIRATSTRNSTPAQWLRNAPAVQAGLGGAFLVILLIFLSQLWGRARQE